MKIVHFLLSGLLTPLLVLGTTIFWILLILPLCAYRAIIGRVYRLQTGANLLGTHSSVFHPLTKEHGRWILAEHGASTVVLTVTLGGPSLDIHAFRTRVSEQVVNARNGRTGPLLYPELQQYGEQWMGYLVWKQDKSFAIANHIKCCQYSEDTGWRDGDFCQEFVRKYKREPLPRGQSPWEVTVIEDVHVQVEGGASSTLLVLKFHHYFADGYSLFNLVKAMADGGAEAMKRYEPKLPTQFEHLASLALYAVRGPFELISSRFEEPDPKKFHIRPPPNAPGVQDIENLFSSFPHPQSKLVLSQTVSMDRIRGVAKQFKVSFTAALFVSISRALRKHFVDQGDGGRVPAYLSTGIAIPSPRRADGLSNRIHFVVFHIPCANDANTGLEAQLCEMELNLVKIKRSTMATTSGLVLSLIGTLPATWTWKYRLFALQSLTFDNFVSIFPGPKSAFEILGRSVLAMNFTVSLDANIPFEITLLTYNGGIQFWVSVTSDIVPAEQVANLVSCIEHEFQTIN